MHDSTRRLLDYARRTTAGLPGSKALKSFADLRRVLDISSGTMTNWKSRGVSKDGALKAERVLGCAAQWVLDGVGEEQIGGSYSNPPPTVLIAAEPQPATYALTEKYLVSEAFGRLAELLLPADELTRLSIAPMLSRLATAPEKSEQIAEMVTAMLKASKDRKATAKA